MCRRVLLVVTLSAVVGAKRVNPEPEVKVNPKARAEDVSKFLKAEAEDAKAGRTGTEIRKAIVYRVQPNSFPILSNCNAADELGELTFLASGALQSQSLDYFGEIIFKHEVEIKVASYPNRAYRHYLRYIDGKPDKDPKEVGIDTIGFKSRENGGEGWYSFPHSLKCGPFQSVGPDCAWRDLRWVRSIHTTCLMETKNDGLKGDGETFRDIFQHFNAPTGSDSFLDYTAKLALTLFRKAFDECPDVGAVEVIPYTHAVRRCCCFNGRHPHKRPQWARDGGICMKDVGQHRVFAGMWSMSRSPDAPGSGAPCAEGHAMYRLDSKRGRCLTAHDGGSEKTSWAPPVGKEGTGQTFGQVFPSLVKSKLAYIGADIWKPNQGYVCPSKFGMHTTDCDCEWASEQC